MKKCALISIVLCLMFSSCKKGTFYLMGVDDKSREQTLAISQDDYVQYATPAVQQTYEGAMNALNNESIQYESATVKKRLQLTQVEVGLVLDAGFSVGPFISMSATPGVRMVFRKKWEVQ